MPRGYCGRILHIDLSQKNIEVQQPDDMFYRKYMGGSCLGAYFVLKNLDKDVDALSPDNLLVFSVSPTTGAPVSGASRSNITSKSPLTGTIGDSQGGGFWGPELKFAGYDALVIKGRADKPVYIWINNNEVEIKDARHLWGKTTGEVHRQIYKDLGDTKIRISQIGPGGENLVRYAGITNDLRHFNGRNGMGAVMGSKNLKAVVIKGSNSLDFYDETAIKNLAKTGAKRIENNSSVYGLRKYGTSQVLDANQETGGLPTRNWDFGVFNKAENISSIKLNEEFLKKRESCWACAVKCKRVVEVNDLYNVDPIYGGPEYESIASLGSYLCIDDLKIILKANELCNKYTIDTISLGGTVAFAMECFENNIININDTDGIELKFGNGKALLNIIEKIVNREGIGDILAEGSDRAAKIFGENSEKFAVTVKSQELPAHMPRVKASLALAYACGPFGPDHQSSQHDSAIQQYPLNEEMISLGFYKNRKNEILDFEKVKLWTYSQRAFSILDTLDLCQFCFGFWPIYNMNDVVDLLNFSTGWSTNLWELMLLGERRINLMKSFNWREGFNDEDDILPEKVFSPIKKGPKSDLKISQEKFLKAREDYYKLAGWNSSGKPCRTKLKELGLDWVIEQIYK